MPVNGTIGITSGITLADINHVVDDFRRLEEESHQPWLAIKRWMLACGFDVDQGAVLAASLDMQRQLPGFAPEWVMWSPELVNGSLYMLNVPALTFKPTGKKRTMGYTVLDGSFWHSCL